MQIEGLRGTTEKPIVIRPFPGERAIFDGTNPIQNRWSRHQENIWKTTLEHDIWQLFCGDKLVHVARWPNASLADGSIWRMEACMRFTDRKFVRGRPTGQTKDGLIYDRNPASLEAETDEQGAESLTVTAGVNPCTLAESGVDFSGAIAVLNLHHWLTWARPITDHEAGRNWFRYDSQGTEMEKYQRRQQQRFINLIEYLDKLVGKLIAKAEELDIYEETYFIFCADNGTAVTAKDRGVERGVHVPYVVKGPGVTRRGITDELTDFADIAPTLLDMAGIEHPDGLRTTRI